MMKVRCHTFLTTPPSQQGVAVSVDEVVVVQEVGQEVGLGLVEGEGEVDLKVEVMIVPDPSVIAISISAPAKPSFHAQTRLPPASSSTCGLSK